MAHYPNQAPPGYGQASGSRPFPRPHQPPAQDSRRSGTFPPLSALVGSLSSGSTASASASGSGSSSSVTGSSSGGHGATGPPPPWTPSSSYADRLPPPPTTSAASPPGGIVLPQPSPGSAWAGYALTPSPHPAMPSSSASSPVAGYYPRSARGDSRSATGAWLSYNDPGVSSSLPKTVPSPQQASWREAPYPQYHHHPPHPTMPPPHSPPSLHYAHAPTSQPLPPPSPDHRPRGGSTSAYSYGAPGYAYSSAYPPPLASPYYYPAPPPPPPHMSPFPPTHGSPPHGSGYAGVPPPPHSPPPPERHRQLSHTGSVTASNSANLSMLQDSDRPRQARNLACEFCRQRKLRCIIDDGNKSCRQCVRRGKECSLPTAPVEESPAVPKAKKRRAADEPAAQTSGKAASPSSKKSRKKQTSPSRGSGSQSFDAGQSMDVSRTASQDAPVNTAMALVPHAQESSWETRAEEANNLLTLHASGNGWNNGSGIGDSGGSSEERALQSSLDAMIDGAPDSQDVDDEIEVIDRSNEVELQPIRMSSLNSDPNWWDRCLSFFGERRQSVRVVETLLMRFLSTHATLTGIFHAPSFVDLVRRPERRQTTQPALIFAALAAAVCDLKLDKAEPYTADVAAADASGKRLVEQLRASAYEYIEATLAKPNSQTIPLAQAATVMALTETEPAGRRRLFDIADYVIRSLGVPETKLIKGSDGRELCSSQSLIRYDRPKFAAPSVEGQIAAEMTSRLAKAPMGLVIRQALQRPDEDDPTLTFPDYSPFVRPFTFWVPSELPDVLPDSYHASMHIARAAAMATGAYARTAKMSPRDGISSDDIHQVLSELEQLEDVFAWAREVNQSDATAIFPYQAQILLVKLSVFTRLSLWRKTKAWTLNDALLNTVASESNSSSEEEEPPLLPSFRWWLSLLSEQIESLEADSNRHITSGETLHATDAEIDSALRHVNLAVQMLTVLPRPPVGIRELLSSALSTLQIHVNLRNANPASSSLGQRIEQVRADVARYGTPSPQSDSPVFPSAPAAEAFALMPTTTTTPPNGNDAGSAGAPMSNSSSGSIEPEAAITLSSMTASSTQQAPMETIVIPSAAAT